MKKKQFNIRLDEPVIKALKDAHKKSDIEKFAAFIRNIFRDFLRHNQIKEAKNGRR